MFVNFNILNQLGSPAINSNTFANRPAAGQTGRLFVSTDTFEIYRDNGTSWDLIGGPGSSTVTGTGASGQVTYWTGASTIAGNNNLFWDIANSRLGIGTTTPGHKLQINGTGTLLSLNGGSDTYMLFAGNGADQYQIGYTDNALDYRRFSIYDSTGAKEVLTIDKQSRYVGINYQYSSLADQPAYTFDVSGSIRSTDSTFLATNGTSQVGINTVSPVTTALIQANKTDGYGLYLNYTTNTGSGTTATALWAINNTAGSGYSAVIEEKTPNTTGGQYPLAIKHSLSSGTAAAGMGTGLHFQLPDDLGNFKTTQLTVETTDASNTTYTTRYRFMAQVNNTSTPLAYLTSVGLGIGNVIPSYKLDVNGTVRAFGVGNTGNFLAVDTNPGGASVNLNPQYGTGLPILYTNGAFPLLFGTNNTENARFTTGGNFLIGTTTDAGQKLQVSGNSLITSTTPTLTINSTTTTGTTIGNKGNRILLQSNSVTVNNGGEIVFAGADTTTYRWGALTGAIQTNSGSGATGNISIATKTNTTDTSLTERLTVTSAGLVGIGTSAPLGNLDVSTSGNTSINITAGSTALSRLVFGTTTANNRGFIDYDNTAAVRAMIFRTNESEAMRITSTGLVGIGTSTPNGILTVIGNTFDIRNSSGGYGTGYGLEVSTNANIPRIDFIDNATYTGNIKSVSKEFYINNSSNNALIFQTNNTTRAKITAGGNFLIGTTSDPGETLTVGPNNNYCAVYVGSGVYFGYAKNAANYVNNASADDAIIRSSNGISFGPGSGSGNGARITSGGNLLIGTTTDNGNRLQVDGQAYIKRDNGYGLIIDRTATTNYNGLSYRTGNVTQWFVGMRENSTNDYIIYGEGLATDVLRLNVSTGTATFSSSLTTGAPSGGTAAAWKLGRRVAATVVVNTTEYIEVDIGGTLYKLATVN